MRRRSRGLVRRRVACPECGEQFTIARRKGVRRFKARLYGCPSCEFVGRWGEFDRTW